jgi:hypothetical protein
MCVCVCCISDLEYRSPLYSFMSTRYIYRTEIKPGKNSDTRIKPLPLANGHGRYITATPERTPSSVGRWGLGIGEWPLHTALYYTV